MSIPMLVRIVRPEELGRLIHHPAEFRPFFFGPLEQPPDPPRPKGILARLFWSPPKKAPTHRLWAVLYQPEASQVLRSKSDWKAPAAEDIADLDKSFEVLHCVLSGGSIDDTGEGLKYCLGGNRAGRTVSQNGDSWSYVLPEEMPELKALLDAISDDVLRERLAALPKDDIPMMDFAEWREGEIYEYVSSNLATLRELVARAAVRGDGLLLVLVV